MELVFVAEAVGIGATVNELLEYHYHVLRDGRVHGPHVREIEAAVFRSIPPSQEEVGHDAALPAVGMGDADKARTKS
jgi:hypothetical protein